MIMMSFQSDKLANKMSWPNETLYLLERIQKHKGGQGLYKRHFPKIIDVLREAAIITGTKSRNRIEGIVIEPQYITSIMNNKIQPKTRSELKVAGYLDVLAKIYTFTDLTTDPCLLLQMYKDLMLDASDSASCIRKNDIVITLKSPDGSKYNRFIKTAVAIDWLFDAYRKEKEHGAISELVLIAAFALDFICIDLFYYGNGSSIARLLILLLLYQNGHEVGRFISLEKIIEETKHDYDEALQQSSCGWHEGEYKLIPWLNYFIKVLLKAYERFAERVGQASSIQRWSSKVLNVQEIIDDFITDFTVQEVKQRCPEVSQTTIHRILNHFAQDGTIQCLERGPNGKWIKLRPISDTYNSLS